MTLKRSRKAVATQRRAANGGVRDRGEGGIRKDCCLRWHGGRQRSAKGTEGGGEGRGRHGVRAGVCALPRFAVLYSEVTIGDTVSKADEHRFFFFFVVVWFFKRCIEEFEAPSS